MGRSLKENEGLMEQYYRIVFSPEADDESVKAYEWYEKVQSGLGIAFRQSLEIKIESIKENPKYSSFVYKNVRSTRMIRFPFNIIYRISDFQIQVLAVFHHSRNPSEWKKRI